MASLYTKVTYCGVAYNKEHEEWLVDLLQRMFVALVLESDVGADKTLIKNVNSYLSRAIEQARRMLPSSRQGGEIEIAKCADDSD